MAIKGRGNQSIYGHHLEVPVWIFPMDDLPPMDDCIILYLFTISEFLNFWWAATLQDDTDAGTLGSQIMNHTQFVCDCQIYG